MKIVSEKGKECTVQNPWPGQAIGIRRNGTATQSLIGNRISFATNPNETIELSSE